jgi:hypothetical protein
MNNFTRADWLRWGLVTVGVAAAASPLSFLMWPAPAGVATPPADILPLLIPIAVVIPALTFGLGVAFILFGWKLVSAGHSSLLSRASFVSIGWLLMNWWPHSNFHRVSNGWGMLTAIDYFFHATAIAATFIVAVFFLTVIRERQGVTEIERGAPELASASTR